MSMSKASSNPSTDVHNLKQVALLPGASARDALNEIQAAQLTLQAFASVAIERLDDLADELRARETRVQPAVEESMLRDPIEQLSAVAAELTALMAEQRQYASHASCLDQQGDSPSPASPRQETSP